MENIKELKKKLKCEKCREPYRDDNSVYIYVRCKHHVCRSCFNSATIKKCPVCQCSTSRTLIPFIGDLFKTMKDYEALQNEYSILKQEKLLLETLPDHHKCIECDELYSDKEMQLCETCHELKFQDHEDVKKNALCSTCAIKKHMRKGHNTVDFFPYFSAYNFSSQSPKIKSNSEGFKSAQNSLNNTLIRFNTLSNNVSENYDLLTDMAQRSKNTKNQVECFEKMKTFIDKSKTIHGEADSEMKNHTTKLEEHLNEMKKWYEKRAENCVDESEIIKLLNSDGSHKNEVDVDI